DAISHVLLLGIVLAYFVVRDVTSPWLLLGAAVSGVLTVALVELIQNTTRVKSDAAIGLVFPALFALGTILATMYTRNAHLDGDQVLLGHVELSAYDQLELGGTAVGPRAAWVLGGIFLANLAAAVVFFKELKLATFDPALAAALGFAPGIIHYALMTAVSVTTVAAFDAVGPVLVVAFLVVPAASAHLLTDRLGVLIGLSVGIGVAAAVGGAWAAVRLDTNVAGTGAAVLGLTFAGVWVFAPDRGLIAAGRRRWRNRRTFHETMLAIHLLQHEGTPAEAEESRLDGLHRHLRWEPGEVAAVVRRAVRGGLVTRAGAGLALTAAGRERARAVLGFPDA
ncbi:MAG: metal ABC transporter permease, partial [Fimbriiglobus sp.]